VIDILHFLSLLNKIEIKNKIAILFFILPTVDWIEYINNFEKNL
jgi:hypothetical protein